MSQTKFLKTKQEIISKGEEIALKCAKELELEVVDVDYVKEGGIYILRILAEGKDGLNIDQATALNNLISEQLDIYDFIAEDYYLEVSSPGLEKELKKDTDIKNAIGEYICIKTYEKVENQKELYGYLLSFENNIIKMEINIKGRKKTIEVDKAKISKIRLAIKF